MLVQTSNNSKSFLLTKLLALLFLFHTCDYSAIGAEASTMVLGKKFVRNYMPNEYGGGLQNWSVCRDHNGVMYFGNQRGILIYDGARWQTLPTKNRTTVRALAVDSEGVVYYGAIGEFGYINYDKSGNPSTVVLSHLIQFESDDVWSVCTFGKNKVCFQTDKTLFVKSGHEITAIPCEGDFFYLAFPILNSVIVHEIGKGFKYLSDSTYQLIPGTEVFKKSRVDFIVNRREERLTIGLRSGQIYRANLSFEKEVILENITEIVIDPKSNPQTWSIYSGIYIHDNLIAVGTAQKGLYLIDTVGNVMFNGSMNNQFVSDAIYDVFLTDDNVLWLAQDLGICKMEIGTEVDYWDYSMGIRGSIASMLHFKENLYCATGYGVFKLHHSKQPGEPQKFQQIEGIQSQCWKLKSMNINNVDRLYAASGMGVFEIRDKAIKCIDIENSYSLDVIAGPNPIIIVGHEDGISFYQHINDQYVLLDKRIVLKGQVRQIVSDKDGGIWFNVLYKGVYRFDKDEILTETGKDIETRKFLSDSVTNYRSTDIFLIDNKIFITLNGVLNEPNVEEGKLNRSAYFGRFFYENDYNVGFLNYDEKQHQLWIDGHYALQFDSASGYKLDSLPIGRYNFNFVNQTYFSDNYIWVGTEKGLFRIESSAISPNYDLFKPLISRIYTSTDTIAFTDSTVVPEFEWPIDKLTLEFSSVNSLGSEKIRYKCRLLGFDANYEILSNVFEKSYTNLLPGEYTFQLITLDVYNRASESRSISFVINKPWYFSVYFILIFVAMWFYLISLYIRRRTRSLRRIKQSLERQVRARTIQIVEQNEELKKLSVIAEKTDNAVSVFSPEGELLWCNDAFYRIYGYHEDEFVAVYGSRIFQTHDFENVRESYKKCIEHKQSVQCEFFTTNRYDEGIWIQTTLTPILDSHGNITRLIAVDTDVTGLKNADEEIRYQKEQLELKNNELKELSAIAEETDNAVVIADKNGDILWINKGFTKIYGYSFDELLTIGKNMADLSSNSNLLDNIINWPKDQISIFYESQNRTKDNRLVWAHTTLTSIRNSEGSVVRLIAIDSDISRLKDAEKQIELQKSELEKLNATKDKFFSIIGHDLRSPFGNFVGITNLILQDREEHDKEQLIQYIVKLNRSAQNSYNLLENLLAWAKSQRGSLNYTPQKTDLSMLIDENLEILQPFAERKKIKIVREYQKNQIAVFDEDMINTVVRNLLFNALKYSHQNGEITVSIDYCNTYVCVSVIDQGVGMSLADKEKLFRLDTTHTTLGTENERGTGLGLILCDEFVRIHGGKIEVESKEGEGSIFKFSLPRSIT